MIILAVIICMICLGLIISCTCYYIKEQIRENSEGAQTQTTGALRREFRNVNVILTVEDAHNGPEGHIYDESAIDKGWIGVHVITSDKDLLRAYKKAGREPMLLYNRDVFVDDMNFIYLERHEEW